ncbi:MAG TPA: hypothetical protein VH599_19570 [Ktedonobacterales bacterium]
MSMSKAPQDLTPELPQNLPQRPALVTFAAVMMFILGGFELSLALLEFLRAPWMLAATYGEFGGFLWIWGIVDALIAVIALYAGYDILRGGEVGRIIGIIIASVSAIRWFFYLPAAPLLGIFTLVVDGLIIYALVAHSEFFRASARA